MQLGHTSTGHDLRHFLQKHRKLSIFSALLLVIFTVVPPSIYAFSTMSQDNVPGTHGNTTRLINNWVITPAGKQAILGDLPLNSALSPDGHFLLVDNGGAGIQSLQVLRTSDSKVIQTIPYTVPHSVFVGLIYSPDGRHAYAAGGGEDVVHTYDVLSSGLLAPAGDVVIGTTTQNPFPTGISISPDGSTLYVANNLTNNVSIVDTATKTVTGTVAIGTYPYTTLVSHDGKTVYASNWGDATISVIDAASKAVTATIKVGNHPTAMVFGTGNILYVTDANSDAISIVDTKGLKELGRISVSLYKDAPLSTSPVGLTISPDHKYLYVANAGNNDIAVVALKGNDGQGAVIGLIPTAWYPTSVQVSLDGSTLYATNGKGRGAGPNDKPINPNPTRKNPPIVDGITGYNDGYCSCTFDRYTGSMIKGTLSTIPVPASGMLQMFTAQVNENDHVGDTSVLARDPGNPIPDPGGTSPIKHVIYIVKENRTYDQVFGDMPVGNGDSSLTLFPQKNSPNIHELAKDYVTLDNFYADAEVSADGHNWINSANASDYNEKMWPQDYSPGVGRNRGYDFEGDSTINLSPGGYIWDAAAEAHITYRDYGEFYASDANSSVKSAKLIPASQADSCPGPVAHTYTGETIPSGDVLCFPPQDINPVTTPNLVGHYDPRFKSFDTSFREADRFAEWQREFDQFVANNNLPQLEILRLPNDHTAGTTPGALTPQAFVAENDLAVGEVVDVVSHSKYWATTAIFATEDDSQNGPDHVDAHRTESLVISPYTYHAKPSVDHTLYDTAAMVRTIELILGLRSLSQYDVAATPMWRSFNATENTKAYTALPEVYPPTQTNSATAYGAQASASMNFSYADAIPEQELNQILWHDIKGANAPYPNVPGVTSPPDDSDG